MKMYFIKNEIVEQCRELKQKLELKIDEFEERKTYKNIAKDELELLDSKIINLCNHAYILGEALNNIKFEEYSYKGYWQDINTLKTISKNQDWIDTY